MLAAHARSGLTLATLAFTAIPLPAAEPAFRGQLVVRPDSTVAVKATEPLVVVSIPVPAGMPVSAGALLAELDLKSLQRALEGERRELEELRVQQRNRPAESGRGGNVTNSALELAIVDGSNSVLALQSRIAQAAVRAPEDGYVVRHLYEVGAKAKKRKPFLEFARLADLRLEIAVPAPEADRYPTGSDVQVTAAADPSRRFRGRVESATPGTGHVALSIRPVELPFLRLDVAEDLRLSN